MRYKLLRGAKSRKGLKAFLSLNAVLWAAKLPGHGLPRMRDWGRLIA
jgi:hypothetical protein